MHAPAQHNTQTADERILICGAGITGMCTALALASRGHRVTVLERDEPPPGGDADRAFFDWRRRGASQFRHPHAFLGLMCNILETNYPDLLDEFYAAGARRLEFRDMLPAELERRYQVAPGDEQLWMLLCRRATIETVLRRYVSRIPGVEILTGITIDGLELSSTADGPVAHGLRVRRDCAPAFGEVLTGTTVIDASGRTSRFPRWLAAAGIAVPEERDDAEIVYYTRHYQRRDGCPEPPRGGKDRASGDLGYLKYGVFPGDNGSFAVIVCTHLKEQALREAIKDGATFDRICRSIPGLAPWLEPGTVDPTTDAFGIGDICAVWRDFAPEDTPLVRNFFAVGDAALRTNPLYGRGCSTGILHAHLLADCFAAASDPTARARLFKSRTEEELRPIFKASLAEDRRGIRRALAIIEGTLLDQPDSFKKWFALAFGDALAAAARYDLHVLRGMMRTVNLLERPGDFLKDWRTRLTLFAYLFRGRKRNAVARMQRGPTRNEMLALIDSEAEAAVTAEAA